MRISIFSLIPMFIFVFSKTFTPIPNTFVGFLKIGQPSLASQPRYGRYITDSFPNIMQVHTRTEPFIKNQIYASKSPFIHGEVPNNKFTSGNIVENTIAHAEVAVKLLKSFRGNKIAADFLQPVFETTHCIKSISDAISLIEEGTKIVVENDLSL